MGCVGVGVCGCVCGCMGVWVCGCVGVWVCGCVGVWVCGCVGVWVFGCVGVWVCECVGVSALACLCVLLPPPRWQVLRTLGILGAVDPNLMNQAHMSIAQRRKQGSAAPSGALGLGTTAGGAPPAAGVGFPRALRLPRCLPPPCALPAILYPPPSPAAFAPCPHPLLLCPAPRPKGLPPPPAARPPP